MLLTFWMWYYWRSWGDSYKDSRKFIIKQKFAIGALLCYNWFSISPHIFKSNEIDLYQKITFPLVSIASILTIPVDIVFLPIEFLYVAINY